MPARPRACHPLGTPQGKPDGHKESHVAEVPGPTAVVPWRRTELLGPTWGDRRAGSSELSIAENRIGKDQPRERLMGPTMERFSPEVAARFGLRKEGGSHQRAPYMVPELCRVPEDREHQHGSLARTIFR